jgi:hypothetical protein
VEVLMDARLLRATLHSAIDRIIDEYVASENSPQQPPSETPVPTMDAPLVIRGEDMGEWSYRWPAVEGTEKFYASRQYEVVTPHKTHRVRLARSERPAWGREDRKRVIVFGQVGPSSSTTFYPWTEFVETDTGQYAAPIPDPDRPRKILASSDTLPDRFRRSQVERTDRLFDQIANGPSLRLVVDGINEASMIQHGYWVARLRNRL